MPNLTKRQPDGEIRSLTGLRGIAACYVVLYHYLQTDTGHDALHKIINHGYIAVDLFFVLSGFVMGLTYAPAFVGGFSGRAYLSFLTKRLARIYPLYIFVLCAVSALTAANLLDASLPSNGALLANALMIQTWGITDSVIGAAWSISTEFAAYLLFPLLILAAVAGKTARTVVLACCATLLLILVAAQSTPALNQGYDDYGSRHGMLDVFGSGTPFPLLRCLAGFSLGLVAFRLVRCISQQQPTRWRYLPEAVALAILVMLAIPNADIALVLGFAVLVVSLAITRSTASWLLGTGAVYFAGEISYSIYLVHQPVQALLRDQSFVWTTNLHLPHAYTVSRVLILLATVVVATATYHGIERPARRWIRRWTGLRARAIEADPAMP